ncbi:MAG: DNA/RNA non-specific endonuclease [Bacteroidetes bacterium]|nr:DNA/RNA non-specific endonuclease [Bacteroidota bacterium]
MICNQFLSAQAPPIDEVLDSLKAELSEVNQARNRILSLLEEAKLAKIRADLKTWGLPDSPYIEHTAMMLSYNEQHEQANWVAHIILPDIKDGAVNRTNDFRPDPKVATGTAVESDYFLKFLQEDSSYIYDGFGYDRGHLAPSADFRWSAEALSESYYYSNMSPQRPDFNRKRWAELESVIRSYVYRHPNTQLYVVTGPLLHDSLPRIERATQRVSIPDQYFKIVVDLKNQRGIGFILPNQDIQKPLYEFSYSIDEVEAMTGFDFGPNQSKEVEQSIEARKSIADWLDLPATDVLPMDPTNLPPGHFNTQQAKIHMGKNRSITVCGRVVSMRKSRSGNLWMNLDRSFPNHIFSAYIPKEHLANFPFNPLNRWHQKQLCMEGKVQDFDKIPTMRIDRPEQAMQISE